MTLGAWNEYLAYVLNTAKSKSGTCCIRELWPAGMSSQAKRGLRNPDREATLLL